MTDDVAPSGRVSRRRGRRDRAAPTGPRQKEPSRHRRPFDPVKAVSDDELEAIHHASLRVLRDIGIDLLHDGARQLLLDAGAELAPSASPERIVMDPDLVASLIATAPSEFTLHAPDPAWDQHIGGDSVVFTDVASAPNAFDVSTGRRTGRREDFRRFVKLSAVLNAVQLHGGYPVEPTDLHPSIRHLHATHDLLTLSPKGVGVYSLGRQRNLDGLEMIRIARGITEDQLEREPSANSVINASSPLRLDHPMAEGILQFSSRNQVIVFTPFTLAGAMAPVTLAGALVQQNAEALFGMALTQAVRPGAPVVYGGFTSNVDMQSGAPAFGTPEFMKAALVGGQLARRYGVPYRSSNVNAANAVDAQAGYESVFSLWGAIMGGANLVWHGAGWMEGGLQASFEKMVLDADLISMVATFLEPLVVDDASLAVEAIREVGPGGHFFGVQHTQDRYRDAFYSPMISDWRNYESWAEAGSPTALDRAGGLVEELLGQHQPPEMDPDRRAELDEFVARRVAEGGVETDF